VEFEYPEDASAPGLIPPKVEPDEGNEDDKLASSSEQTPYPNSCRLSEVKLATKVAAALNSLSEPHELVQWADLQKDDVSDKDKFEHILSEFGYWIKAECQRTESQYPNDLLDLDDLIQRQQARIGKRKVDIAETDDESHPAEPSAQPKQARKAKTYDVDDVLDEDETNLTDQGSDDEQVDLNPPEDGRATIKQKYQKVRDSMTPDKDGKQRLKTELQQDISDKARIAFMCEAANFVRPLKVGDFVETHEPSIGAETFLTFPYDTYGPARKRLLKPFLPSTVLGPIMEIKAGDSTNGFTPGEREYSDDDLFLMAKVPNFFIEWHPDEMTYMAAPGDHLKTKDNTCWIELVRYNPKLGDYASCVYWSSDSKSVFKSEQKPQPAESLQQWRETLTERVEQIAQNADNVPFAAIQVRGSETRNPHGKIVRIVQQLLRHYDKWTGKSIIRPCVASADFKDMWRLLYNESEW
jgi:hypothetical protein